MKTITDDPEGFFENGGWDFLKPESDDEGEKDDDDLDEEDETFEVSEDEISDDDESEDSEYSEVDEDDSDDDEEEGKSGKPQILLPRLFLTNLESQSHSFLKIIRLIVYAIL